MKVIDLLNKIANGEEVPKKIRVHYRVFEKYLNHNAYLNTEDEENYKYLTDLPRLFDDDRDWLNEEVEILEEEKKIPNEININLAYIDKEYLLDKKDIDKKINEIINRHNILVDKVSDYFKSKETLEEQKKIPEKLPYYSLEKIQKAKNKDEWREERISLLEKRVEDLHIKMNELLDYLKSKGDE